jgi:hypothetical protein
MKMYFEQSELMVIIKARQAEKDNKYVEYV